MAKTEKRSKPVINNLPAKHMSKVVRPSTHRDRTKYNRKDRGWETSPDLFSDPVEVYTCKTYLT